MEISDYISLATTALGIAVLMIAIWSARIAAGQLREVATTKLFNIFSDEKSREKRRWVYNNWENLIDETLVETWITKKVDFDRLETVCLSLEWAGLLAERGLLHKKDAIALYGDSLIRTWTILKPWLLHMRKERQHDDQMWAHFQSLAEEALNDSRYKDWKEKGIPIYKGNDVIRLDFNTSKPVNDAGI